VDRKKNVEDRKESCLEPAHTHHHPHTQTKAVLNRMARLIGHMQSVRRMVEDGRDCSEVLLQLSAVDAALKNVGKIILKDHMEHCIIDAVQDNDREALIRLEQAIDRFMR
jgi:DNA-binding FrmR family transcriptional regulator